MPMRSLNSPEAKTLLGICKLFNSLATPLVHSRILLHSSAQAIQYLSTLQTKPNLATYIRRLELQGDQWDADTALDVLRAVNVLGRLSDGSLGLKWLTLSLTGLEIDEMRVREMEDVLGGMQGISSFEWYCPGHDLLAVSLSRIFNSWTGSLSCVGLLLQPPPSLALLQTLTSLPNLTHLYLNAGSPNEAVTSLTPPALDDSPTVSVLAFYLHLLDHAKTRGIRILLYLRKVDELSEPLLRLCGNDPILREILTFTSSVDNQLFGHVFEDMDNSEWRDRVSCDSWREKMAVPLQVLVSPSL
ncbi:hypothetical protein BDY24DRAFT_373770 [Mrakia frigida]|uniref:uncharacterized protein n=1 Tax=Mrakia frigida TaxID=29902 RepID=UPI003FCC17EF